MTPLILAHAGEDHGAAANVPSGPRTTEELLTTWGLEPVTIICLAVSAILYVRGVRRFWRASGFGHGIRRWEAGAFACGWLTLFIALVSPIHPWGRVLFSVHMTQHELLMLMAAPLIVLGKPLVAFLRAIPTPWAWALAHATGVQWWQHTWRTLTRPGVAFVIQTVALWMWHVPVLFEACLYNEFVHLLQHVSFVASAALFWWAVTQGRQHALGYGVAVLFVFSTAMHSGLLGVLLAFDDSVWYPSYARTTQRWGLDAVEDQQLVGLIMWIPAGVLYIIPGIILFGVWLRESEARVLRREARLLISGRQRANI